MTTESIQVEGVFPVDAARIYDVWLDEEEHTSFTGAKASIEKAVGGKHTAYDDYIWGTFLELEPGRRIVQAWRTTEFPADAHDSRVEVLLEGIEGGTRVTIVHSNIPEGQGEQYRGGWTTHYLEPLARFLAAAHESAPNTSRDKTAAPVPSVRAGALKKTAAKKSAPAKAAPAKKSATKKAAKKAAAKQGAGVAAKKTAKKAGAKRAAKKSAAKAVERAAPKKKSATKKTAKKR